MVYLRDGRWDSAARHSENELNAQWIVEQSLLSELERQTDVAGVETL